MRKAIHLLNSIKFGGAENVAINYSVIFNKLNICSTIVASKDSSELEKRIREKNIHIENKLSKSLLKSADYIFIHSNQRLFSLFKYFFLIKRLKKKVIYIQHLNYTQKKFRFLAFFINKICTDFIQITPMTNGLVNRFVNIDRHLIINFYMPRYDKGSYDQICRMVRNENYIGLDQKVFMFSGVFRAGKGLMDFIKIAEYFRSVKEYIFLIVGDGLEADYVKNYKYDNIRWAGFQADVEKYLIASDVYLFLSKFEMLPMALMEAINTDKRILAYNIPINNLLLNNKTFSSLESMIESINSGEEPSSFQKYDEEYAVKMFQCLLNK